MCGHSLRERWQRGTAGWLGELCSRWPVEHGIQASASYEPVNSVIMTSLFQTLAHIVNATILSNNQNYHPKQNMT